MSTGTDLVLPPGRTPEVAVRAELNALPVAERSRIRQKALRYSPGSLKRIRAIAEPGSGASPMVRLLADKTLLAVAAVLGGATIPRDVVQEKIELTAKLLQDRLTPEQYKEVADDLTRLWGDV